MAGWQGRGALVDGQRARLSSYGYVVFFVGVVAMAVVAAEARVAVVVGATLLFAGFFHRDACRSLGRRRLWLFIVPTLMLSPLVIGQKDVFVWGLSLSREGFWAGVWMTLRGLSIALAAAVLASAVSVSQMAELFERMRLKGLGFALGVATNMLPTIMETMETSYQAVRLRGGFRRQRLRTVKLLLVTVIAGSLRSGDDIVSAAEARAFDPTTFRRPRLHMTRADVALAGTVFLLGAALLMV